ncbi:MAG: DEAD/DEAH box helicase [Planctomycetia bacterium]|nr:DEAD/DEAH box helicase [Planctomycetia bacterium]
MTFDDLGLTAALLRAVKTEGYSTPTPIQEQAIGHVLEGRDLLGVAQTGTGKTAAFALPILQRMGDNGGQPRARGRKARVLVLSPTRELATQIAESFSTYGRHTGLRQAVIYGGVSQNPQAKAVRDGVDILVATPGRLMDLMNQGLLTLGGIEILVIDEADRMFDMGFIRDIQKIVAKLPKKRQTLLFSATMPADIRQLADKILSNPVRVQIESKNAAADLVQQSVYFVEKRNKPALLKHFIERSGVTRALVFTRTKHGADKVAKHLSRAGIRALAIHGDKTQAARQRALVNFKSTSPPILVATDVAARGLDIDEVSHVVNYDLPNVAETYVHRIGRTGRAGATGIAVSFCDHDEREHLRNIEKLLRKKTPVCSDHPEYAAAKEPAAGGHSSAKPNRPSAPPQRKPHAAGPADDRHRSRRRKFGPGTAKAKPAGHTTMW